MWGLYYWTGGIRIVKKFRNQLIADALDNTPCVYARYGARPPAGERRLVAVSIRAHHRVLHRDACLHWQGAQREHHADRGSIT